MRLRPWGMQPLFGLLCCTLAFLPTVPATAADDPQALLNTAQATYNSGDYEQARVLYQRIVDDFPDLIHSGYALVGLANIHMKNREDEQSLARLDQVLANYPQPALLGKAAMSKMSLLANRLKDYPGGIEFGTQWLVDNGDLMSNFDRAMVVIYLSYCYDKSDQPEEALGVFEQEIISTPSLFIHALYHERLMELQLRTGHPDDALTTARVGYALCEFDQTSIEAMSNLVKKAYASRGEIFKATQFFAAQEDPTKDNPLADVPMPEVTPEQFGVMLGACGDDCRLKVCTHLYAGDYREAMMAAQEFMAQAPAAQMVQALNQVARVFKAKDLNLVRGNQFLEYAKTGEGTNPLGAFFDEL